MTASEVFSLSSPGGEGRGEEAVLSGATVRWQERIENSVALDFQSVFRNGMVDRPKGLALSTCWVQSGSMKTSIDLDDELAAEVKETVSATREKPATVLRMAIRAGLPLVRNRFQAQRPEGYFAAAYRNYPKERQQLEEAFAKATTGPDR